MFLHIYKWRDYDQFVAWNRKIKKALIQLDLKS